jgi:hypothetical protein
MKSSSPNTVYLVDNECSYSATLKAVVAPIPAEEKPVKEEENSAERRVHTRHACRLNSLCKPVGRHQTGNPWKGWIEDVSVEGLKLTLNRRFEPGALLAVEVDVTKDELINVFHSAISRFFLAKVVRVVRRRDGKYTLGCLLVKKFNDEDLDHFIEYNGFRHLKEDEPSEAPTLIPNEADPEKQA